LQRRPARADLSITGDADQQARAAIWHRNNIDLSMLKLKTAKAPSSPGNLLLLMDL
jgi:hypothetical protein